MANKNERDKECCYEYMANEGKEGGQSITKIDNSIHSEYWSEPLENAYESKKWNSNGYDQSGMKGK